MHSSSRKAWRLQWRGKMLVGSSTTKLNHNQTRVRSMNDKNLPWFGAWQCSIKQRTSKKFQSLYATLYVTLSVRPSVRPSVRRSEITLLFRIFRAEKKMIWVTAPAQLIYCPCPPARALLTCIRPYFRSLCATLIQSIRWLVGGSVYQSFL